LASLKKQHPEFLSDKKLETMAYDLQSKKNAEKIDGFRTATSFRSVKFAKILDILNGHSVGSSDEHVNINGIRLNFPIIVEDFAKLNLDKKSEKEVVEKLKEKAKQVQETGVLSPAFSILIIKAILKNFEISGMDVINE
jgi:hypothetical protein